MTVAYVCQLITWDIPWRLAAMVIPKWAGVWRAARVGNCGTCTPLNIPMKWLKCTIITGCSDCRVFVWRLVGLNQNHELRQEMEGHKNHDMAWNTVVPLVLPLWSFLSLWDDCRYVTLVLTNGIYIIYYLYIYIRIHIIYILIYKNIIYIYYGLKMT
jgi:hypothetical protein